MEQITGRIVKNAEIRRTKDSREFVTFTVAVNDRYKPKNGQEVKETRYFSCAYWQSTKVKEALRQGTIVVVFGKVNINAYKGTDGEYHANLTCHANFIDILGSGGKKDEAKPAANGEHAPEGTPTTKDDLPF